MARKINSEITLNGAVYLEIPVSRAFEAGSRVVGLPAQAAYDAELATR